jgi:predicted nucleotidyltransferase
MPMHALEPSEIETLRQFRAALQQVLPGIVREVRLFGSRAQRVARPDGDWDLAVIVDPDVAEDPDLRDVVSDVAFDFLLRGWPIHGVVMTTSMLAPGAEWRADAVGDAARHGIRIG